jgi:hypothetical protein
MDDTFPVTPDDITLRRELVAAGWTDRDIARQVRRGTLTKVRYGAYVRSELVQDLDPVGMMRVRSRAVLRTAHPESVLGQQCALAEYAVPLWGVDLTTTHVTRTDGRAGRREAGVAHHRGRLSDEEWTTREGVRLVRPARAAIEVVTTHPPEVGLVVVSGVLHLGLASRKELHDAAARASRWPNSLNVRLVLARADARLTSVAEARTWHLFHQHHVPRPEMQVEVHDDDRALLGIVDFLWRSRRVFLEFDGRIKYEHFRRPGETLEQYLLREKRREELICQVTGWVCIRITWADLERPVVTARRIRKLLDSRRDPAA